MKDKLIRLTDVTEILQDSRYDMYFSTYEKLVQAIHTIPPVETIDSLLEETIQERIDELCKYPTFSKEVYWINECIVKELEKILHKFKAKLSRK